MCCEKRCCQSTQKCAFEAFNCGLINVRNKQNPSESAIKENGFIKIRKSHIRRKDK